MRASPHTPALSHTGSMSSQPTSRSIDEHSTRDVPRHERAGNNARRQTPGPRVGPGTVVND